jgi:hypothetical protein
MSTRNVAVPGAERLRTDLTDAPLHLSWRDRVRRPRSPRAIALLALWLAVVGNLKLWPELYRFGGGAGMLVSAAAPFVIVLAALSALCWIGSALATERGIDLACVGRRLDVPQTHDDLYRPALGLFDVTTPTYDRALDTFVGCRGRSP